MVRRMLTRAQNNDKLARGGRRLLPILLQDLSYDIGSGLEVVKIPLAFVVCNRRRLTAVEIAIVVLVDEDGPAFEGRFLVFLPGSIAIEIVKLVPGDVAAGVEFMQHEILEHRANAVRGARL